MTAGRITVLANERRRLRRLWIPARFTARAGMTAGRITVLANEDVVCGASGFRTFYRKGGNDGG